MADPQFIIRYRQRTNADATALLVEDDDGKLHVFTGQHIHPYLRESSDPARRASILRELGWVSVPQVAPYSLTGLRNLLGPRAL